MSGNFARWSVVFRTIILVRIAVGCLVAMALTVAFLDLPQQWADSLDDEEGTTGHNGPYSSVSARRLVTVG
jgi:hypothetical protein